MEAVKRITYHTLDPYIFAPSLSLSLRERAEGKKRTARKIQLKGRDVYISHWLLDEGDTRRSREGKREGGWATVTHRVMKGRRRKVSYAVVSLAKKEGRRFARERARASAMPSFLISSL